MVTKLGRTSKPRKPLGAVYDWKKIEERTRRFYADPNARASIARAVSRSKRLGYVEGPPTLNDQPHVGHVRGRMMKDIWYRQSTLQGKNVVFRGGWDTQGLPVELKAEKEMGLSGNKWDDLRQVGEDKLVQECKALIGRYRGMWEEADRLLGLMMDHGNDYMTYRDSYIEREWKFLEVGWKKGLFGEGYKVVPYCPGCQTALSHAELVEGGYEKLEDPSLYYKVRASDGSFLALWTTMPFTVVTDELVGVKPGADYEYVEVGGETWVVCSARKEEMAAQLGVRFGRTLKTVKGRELEGLSYVHPLLGSIPGLRGEEFAGKVHKVVAEEFVDVSTGTGIVHMSPANGEDDFDVATRRGIPVFAPFDDEVKFTPEAGVFSGLFARDADGAVVRLLRESGALVWEGRLVHDYPVCWRSAHRLVWLARREYFYWVDRLGGDLTKAASEVEYFFDGPRNRFLSFVAESPPWCITRERVWGTPLPVWVCESCKEKTPAFSRREILAHAVELPDGPSFELHRPWIDRVVLRCPKCGGRALREAFVLDTWHNSGAAPYSAFTDAERKALVPVEFLTEGIDQTRGWAYHLLALNVIMTGKPVAPFRAFLFQGHVLDEHGQKMSKSLGNVVQGLDLLRNNSVDVARLYMTSKASPEDSVSLDMKEMAGRPYQVLSTLYHLHVYLRQNGEVDGFDPRRHTLRWARGRRLTTEVDDWALAKASRAEAAAVRGYAEGRYNEASRALEELVISHVSQNYVRMVRGELWDDGAEGKGRRLAIYSVLGDILERADVLLHPVAPLATEFLYQEVFARDPWSAPLLSRREGRPRSKALRSRAEGAVDLALKIESASNSARTRARLKRRWPLRELLVLLPGRGRAPPAGTRDLVAALCNVKAAVFVSSPARFPARFRLEPNASRIGALFKERTGPVLRAARALQGEEATLPYAAGKPIVLGTSFGPAEVPAGAYDMKVEPSEGYEVGESGGVFVALKKEREPELIAEGLVRDLARRLQALRKERGFAPTQVLEAAAVAGLDEEEAEMLRSRSKELAFLVRVRRAEVADRKGAGRDWKEDDVDGKAVYLDVG